jgi:protein involved in polysaccharide export with SLBB domain
MINRQKLMVCTQGIVSRQNVGILVWMALFTLGVTGAMAQEPTGIAQQTMDKAVSAKVIGNDGSQPSRAEIEQYRIGPGDQVSIDFYGKAQLSRLERVDARGMIRMPLIDEDIRAGCRTENELADEIARMYRVRQLLKNPTVSVSVKDFQSQPVAVIGAVKTPGQFKLQRSVRLLELVVFHAGGPTATAGRKIQILSTVPPIPCEGSPSLSPGNASVTNAEASVVTPGNAATTNAEAGVVTYDLKDLMQGNDAMNPYVHQGDIINIPAAEEVLIVGQVSKPSAVSIAEPMTLSRAIATVGGILPDGKKDKIRIRRQIPGSATTNDIFVDIKARDKSQGEDFLLQGGDIVEVSGKTGFQAALSSFTKSLLPMVVGLPTRVIRPY